MSQTSKAGRGPDLRLCANNDRKLILDLMEDTRQIDAQIAEKQLAIAGLAKEIETLRASRLSVGQIAEKFEVSATFVNTLAHGGVR